MSYKARSKLSRMAATRSPPTSRVLCVWTFFALLCFLEVWLAGRSLGQQRRIDSGQSDTSPLPFLVVGNDFLPAPTKLRAWVVSTPRYFVGLSAELLLKVSSKLT